ncbi:MAG: zinc-ribbon domain-containing protein [Alphaproteobacteria bacterium]|nr:zinc-ribbon domain-containing protein [Alphaproteobacteria bacterium]
MRVTCPNCGSKFKVPDKALGTTGRKLKCGKCEHQWFQQPEADAPAAATEKPKAKAKAKSKAKAEPKPPPEPEATEPDVLDSGDAGDPADPSDAPDPAFEEEVFSAPPLGDVSRFRPRGKADQKPKPIALYLLLAIIVLIPTVLLLGRSTLVESWPPIALLYDKIGMHVAVDGEGLELRNVFAQRRQEGTITVLVVAGEIRNPSDQLMSLPALRGSVLDAHGDELQTWLFTPDSQILPPGEVITFTSEFPAPSESANQVHVAFTHERPSAGLGY